MPQPLERFSSVRQEGCYGDREQGGRPKGGTAMNGARRSIPAQSTSRMELSRNTKGTSTSESQPLRQCVRESIDEFFSHMGDHPCHGLYAMVIAEVEAPLLEAVMNHTCGNQSSAAEILGVNRGTLRKKLREYNLL